VDKKRISKAGINTVEQDWDRYMQRQFGRASTTGDEWKGGLHPIDEDIQCAVCGKYYKRRANHQKYCSSKCRTTGERNKNREYMVRYRARLRWS